MNRPLIIVMLSALSFSVAAQCDRKQLPDTVLFKKLNQNFSALATGQGDAINLSNYGSFEPVNGEFKLNVFGPLGKLQKKKAAFYSISAGGKLIGDNTGVLFSNSKFNAGMKLGFKLHLPPISFEMHHKGSNEKKILDMICEEYRKYILDSSNAVFDHDSSFLSVRLHQSEIRRDTILARINTNEMLRDVLTKQLDKTAATDTATRLRLTTQLLEIYKQTRQAINDTAALNVQIRKDSTMVARDFERDNEASRLLLMAKKDFLRKKDSLEMTLETKGAKASWFSVIGDLGRRKYYLFADDLPFAEQFKEQKFTTSSFGAEFNFVGYADNKKSVFAGPLPNFHTGNIGFSRIRSNNISDYSTTEMTDARKYASGDSSHSLGTKYQVYTDSITDYRGWRLYGNYYRTFSQKQRCAWHIFADLEIRDTKENPVNFGAGLLFSIKNKKDNTLLNIEVYGKLIDIGKALPTDESFFLNRNEMGIQIGLPLNIPTFK